LQRRDADPIQIWREQGQEKHLQVR